jgi:hypothetical protein
MVGVKLGFCIYCPFPRERQIQTSKHAGSSSLESVKAIFSTGITCLEFQSLDAVHCGFLFSVNAFKPAKRLSRS